MIVQVLFHAALMTFGIFMFKETGDSINLAFALLNAIALGGTGALAGLFYLMEKSKETGNE